MAPSRSRCRWCGLPAEMVGHISWSGACEECGERRMRENMLAVTGRDEKAHAEWRAKWLAGCGNAGRPPTPYPPDA